MSTSLSKNISVFQNALYLNLCHCIVYMYVFEHCINDFYLWHCPVCMEILIIHIVWIIDVYTHVKIFTLVSQVNDSMMLLVHIFHIYCNICTRHICNIYVTDIYVTYMSVTHTIAICLLPHLHLKFKYVTYLYSTIICPLYFTYNFDIYVPYSFFS